LTSKSKLSEFGVNLSNNFHIGMFDVIKISFLVFGWTFLYLIVQQDIVILCLVLVKLDESLRGESAILQHFSYFQEILEQNHQECALSWAIKHVTVDMLDHVIDKFTMIQIAQ